MKLLSQPIERGLQDSSCSHCSGKLGLVDSGYSMGYPLSIAALKVLLEVAFSILAFTFVLRHIRHID